MAARRGHQKRNEDGVLNRPLNQQPGQTTRRHALGQARASNVGWRIDFRIATPGLAALARSKPVDLDQRCPDHAPALAPPWIRSLWHPDDPVAHNGRRRGCPIRMDGLCVSNTLLDDGQQQSLAECRRCRPDAGYVSSTLETGCWYHRGCGGSMTATETVRSESASDRPQPLQCCRNTYSWGL